MAGNAVIVRGKNGNRKFTLDDVNDHNITIIKDGQPVDLHQLRVGDKLTATIITRGAPVVVTASELSASVAALPPTAVPAAVPTMAPAHFRPRLRRRGSGCAAGRSDDGPPAAMEAPTAAAAAAPAEACQDGFPGLGLDRSPGARDSHPDLLEPQPEALTLVPEAVRSLAAPGHSPGAVASRLVEQPRRNPRGEYELRQGTNWNPAAAPQLNCQTSHPSWLRALDRAKTIACARVQDAASLTKAR